MIKLTYGDRLILVRNQNEIRELQEMKKNMMKDIDKNIDELVSQNREILGRE